jgi:hypothetical protein
MRMLLDTVLAADPPTVVPWTGREMPVAKFVPTCAASSPSTAGTIVGNSDKMLGKPD